MQYLVNHQFITKLLFTVPTNLSWLHQGCLPGGPRPRRDHGVHERPLGPCLEFDSTPTPDTLLLLPSGISVSGVESWVRKLAQKVLATRKSGTLWLRGDQGDMAGL